MNEGPNGVQCGLGAEALDLYLDGALSEEARARVDMHLLTCERCAYEVRSMEQARELLRVALLPAGASPAFVEKAGARLEDAVRDVLKPASAASERQWSLPLLSEP